MSVVTSGSTRRITEPPGPPLPPSGPPSGLNFSRCTDATPWPPRPALTCSVTRSTKVGTAMGASSGGSGGGKHEGRPVRDALRWSRLARPTMSRVRSLARHGVDDAAAAAGAELDRTPDQREQRVVPAATDAAARVEVGATLAHDDLAGVDDLAAVALDAEALGVGVAAVLGGRRALLVCHFVSFVCAELWLGSSSGAQREMSVTLTWVYFWR